MPTIMHTANSAIPDGILLTGVGRTGSSKWASKQCLLLYLSYRTSCWKRSTLSVGGPSRWDHIISENAFTTNFDPRDHVVYVATCRRVLSNKATFDHRHNGAPNYCCTCQMRLRGRSALSLSVRSPWKRAPQKNCRVMRWTCAQPPRLLFEFEIRKKHGNTSHEGEPMSRMDRISAFERQARIYCSSANNRDRLDAWLLL